MKKVIMVVEDNAPTRRMITEGLILKGYHVIEAEDGRKALSLLDGRPVDVIVTDFNMPYMNGTQLTKEIRCLLAYIKTPVLILSGETEQEKIESAVNSSITGWIKKPIDINKLDSLIQRASQSRRNDL